MQVEVDALMRKPYQHELQVLVEWFTYHMSQETRKQLMGDLPTLYKLLYPSVSDDVLAKAVKDRIEDYKRQIPAIPSNYNVVLPS
jgi:hypothetical protein